MALVVPMVELFMVLCVETYVTWVNLIMIVMLYVLTVCYDKLHMLGIIGFVIMNFLCFPQKSLLKSFTH